MIWILLACFVVGVVFLKFSLNGRSLFLTAKNRAVLITGCDSGFGRAAALKFADLGAAVFACCLTPDGAAALKNECPDLPNLHAIVQDITSEQSVENSLKQVRASLGSHCVWAVINNAGVTGMPLPDDLLNLDLYKNVMEVNLYGPIRVCHAFKNLVKKARGRFIFTTSVRGIVALPEGAPYTCTKFALEAYADTLRRDLACFGVSVHLVEPGGFRTGGIKHVPEMMEKYWKESLSAEQRSEYGQVWFDSRLKEMSESMDKSQVADLSPVINAYIDAALGLKPKIRYLAGRDARFIYYPLSLSPAWAQDWYFRREMSHLPKPEIVS